MIAPLYLKAAGVAAALALLAGSYYGAYHHGRTVEKGAQALAALAAVEDARAGERALAKLEAARVAKDAAKQLTAAKKAATARRNGQNYATANPRPQCVPAPDHRGLLDSAVDAANSR